MIKRVIQRVLPSSTVVFAVAREDSSFSTDDLLTTAGLEGEFSLSSTEYDSAIFCYDQQKTSV